MKVAPGAKAHLTTQSATKVFAMPDGSACQGITQTDLLVINKTDLAPYVGADLEVMRRDAELVRGGKPFLFTNCRTGDGVYEVLKNVLEGAGVRAIHH